MDLTLNSAAIPKRPFALAFSGGGDSTALLHALREKSPLVFIVDHGLRASSADEAKTAHQFAQALGLEAKILSWTPEPIHSALQVKARTARYRLLGEACRAANIHHLLTGHTEDDQAETVLMRLKAGGSWRGAAAMRAVTPSPLWPELANINLCRPMLGVSRANIRQYLKTHRLSFIDDPSNENRGFARIRARDELRDNPPLRRDMLLLSREMGEAREKETASLSARFLRDVSSDEFGNLFLSAPPNTQLLAPLIRAASGTSEQPKGDALQRLKEAMVAASFRGASLGGALVFPSKSGRKPTWLITRDPVVATGRGGVPALKTQPISSRTLWDGRFWVEGQGELSPTRQTWVDAPKPLKDAIMSCPSRARGALPLWTRGGQIVAIGPYGVEGQLHNQVKSAVLPRLERQFTVSSA